MDYITVCGLEVHTELATKTKIFCNCTTEFGGEPNTHVCEICSGMPGTLPVVNKKVVEFAVRTGLALNCEITQYNKFDRKNYFYPDLPKAYQISQLYLPICRNGWVEINDSINGGKKKVRIHEIHMEEDAGKLVHDEWTDSTLVNYNRCGVPLLEIVSEPDIASADEAVEYGTGVCGKAAAFDEIHRRFRLQNATGLAPCRCQCFRYGKRCNGVRHKNRNEKHQLL